MPLDSVATQWRLHVRLSAPDLGSSSLSTETSRTKVTITYDDVEVITIRDETQIYTEEYLLREIRPN